MTRCQAGRHDDGRHDDGQITLLALGYALIAFLVIAVVADVAAVHLARTQLTDVAEAAALDAADALAEAAYRDGLDSSAAAAVPVSDDTVRTEVARYLTTYEPTTRLQAVRVRAGTGTTDGQSATVVLAGRARLPVAAFVVDSWNDGITVTASATARAPLVSHLP